MSLADMGITIKKGMPGYNFQEFKAALDRKLLSVEKDGPLLETDYGQGWHDALLYISVLAHNPESPSVREE